MSFGLGLGSGSAALDFRAQNSLAYYIKNPLSVTFKFLALPCLVEKWARAFSGFRLMYCGPIIGPRPVGSGLGPFEL